MSTDQSIIITGTHADEARIVAELAPLLTGRQILTAGVDVATDRIEIGIVGWYTRDEIIFENYQRDHLEAIASTMAVPWALLSNGRRDRSGPWRCSYVPCLYPDDLIVARCLGDRVGRRAARRQRGRARAAQRRAASRPTP